MKTADDLDHPRKHEPERNWTSRLLALRRISKSVLTVFFVVAAITGIAAVLHSIAEPNRGASNHGSFALPGMGDLVQVICEPTMFVGRLAGAILLLPAILSALLLAFVRPPKQHG